MPTSVYRLYTRSNITQSEGASPRAYVMLMSVYTDTHVVGIVLTSLYPGNG